MTHIGTDGEQCEGCFGAEIRFRPSYSDDPTASRTRMFVCECVSFHRRLAVAHEKIAQPLAGRHKDVLQ